MKKIIAILLFCAPLLLNAQREMYYAGGSDPRQYAYTDDKTWFRVATYNVLVNGEIVQKSMVIDSFISPVSLITKQAKRFFAGEEESSAKYYFVYDGESRKEHNFFVREETTMRRNGYHIEIVEKNTSWENVGFREYVSILNQFGFGKVWLWWILWSLVFATMLHILLVGFLSDLYDTKKNTIRLYFFLTLLTISLLHSVVNFDGFWLQDMLCNLVFQLLAFVLAESITTRRQKINKKKEVEFAG